MTSGKAPTWDEHGTPTTKQPDCPNCGADEIGSHFSSAWCCGCGRKGTLVEPGIVVMEAAQ